VSVLFLSASLEYKQQYPLLFLLGEVRIEALPLILLYSVVLSWTRHVLTEALLYVCRPAGATSGLT
jgi:hypothetical protein